MKLAGMGLVMAGCIGIGVYYQMREIFRYRNLQELLKAMTVLEGEIGTMRTPLPDALFQVSERTGGITAAFFQGVANSLADGQGEFAGIWKCKLGDTVSAAQLREQDKNALEELGNMLGYLDVEMQMQSIRLCKRRLETGIKELENEKEKQSKLYPVLGTMAGVLLCILIV
jgi:stage III sporulation protein AB